MNAVEIADAVSDLFQQDFAPAEFPFAFLEAFGNKEVTIKRLRKGDSNASDVPGGVLQRNNIHLAVCDPGSVADTLNALRKSPKTASNKVKFVLATDGEWLEAEDIVSGDALSTPYTDLPNHFAFFLALAGISAVKEIKENPIDIRATGRLNKLYVELLKENPDWATEARRPDMNHFMARLIFCFFAEDTGIFHDSASFTDTVSLMTESDGSNTAQVIGRIFEAMNISIAARNDGDLPLWAQPFPYVNGGLFSGSLEAPRFTRIARSYLLRSGELNWRQINPDIFGSMIQAVADDEERGALGMHYTSVPNILKVLNPLFLDDLRAQLDAAGDNPRMLLNLRKRMARMRVFDPACGSGNFLVIAYKEMRKIEATINRRRGEAEVQSELRIENFRGIEIRDFAADIARLALIIAEYQCDVLYRGQKLALAQFLPLNKMNWIVCGNALQLDWLQVCPPTGTGVKVAGTDLFSTPLDQAEIDFANEGGETYVCGNPPYLGKGKKEDEHLQDMERIFGPLTDKFGYIDYVGCWFLLAAQYCRKTNAVAALVATNSISQGRQLPQLWPHVLGRDIEIVFAHQSFKWANSAARNAGVTCVIIGIAQEAKRLTKVIYTDELVQSAGNINAYLLNGSNLFVVSTSQPLATGLPIMLTGSVPNDGGYLLLSLDEAQALISQTPEVKTLIHPFFGSQDYLQGLVRYCLVISDENLNFASSNASVAERLAKVRALRLLSKKKEAREHLANVPHRFQHRAGIAKQQTLIIPSVSSERREWFPVGLLDADTVVSNLAFMMLDAPLWNMALIASKLHLIWIRTVCGKLKTDYRYSNTLGWNTFPVPTLTASNKTELTRCAEDILLAREAHFPATIADLYDPDAMPDDLRRAHERNDEVLERIYIGRRFKNDTERLEKLFEMYTKMTQAQPAPKKVKAKP